MGRSVVQEDSSLNNISHWLEKLRKHLTAERLSPLTIRGYIDDGRRFLVFLDQRDVSLRKATPADALAFLDYLRRRYKRRVGHAPPNDIRWRCEFTPSMHALLRLAQGQWPPVSATDRRIEWFRTKLTVEKFTPDTLRHYLSAVRELLDFLEPRQIEPDDVTAQDVDEFLQARLKRYRQKHSRPVASASRARSRTGGVSRPSCEAEHSGQDSR